MKIFIDNGHGLMTAGKRSPDGHFRCLEIISGNTIVVNLYWISRRIRHYGKKLIITYLHLYWEGKDLQVIQWCHSENVASHLI